jgi:hypothetical protein
MVILEKILNNNHGCAGSRVEIEPTSDTEGIVVGGSQCSQCWQVGHDDSSSPIAIGTRVRIPDGMNWLEAQRDCTDHRLAQVDVSNIYCSLITPDELEIMSSN